MVPRRAVVPRAVVPQAGRLEAARLEDRPEAARSTSPLEAAHRVGQQEVRPAGSQGLFLPAGRRPSG